MELGVALQPQREMAAPRIGRAFGTIGGQRLGAAAGKPGLGQREQVHVVAARAELDLVDADDHRFRRVAGDQPVGRCRAGPCRRR